MKQTMTTISDRTQWSDLNWAEYLNCSVEKVAEYRTKLNDEFFASIVLNKITGKYCFALYRWHLHPSGHKSLQLSNTSKTEFNTEQQAAKHAISSIIPNLILSDFWAKSLKLHSKSLQMLVLDSQNQKA